MPLRDLPLFTIAISPWCCADLSLEGAREVRAFRKAHGQRDLRDLQIGVLQQFAGFQQSIAMEM